MTAEDRELLTRARDLLEQQAAPFHAAAKAIDEALGPYMSAQVVDKPVAIVVHVPQPEDAAEPKQRAKHRVGATDAIVEALKQSPGCDLKTLCQTVYGTTTDEDRHRLADLLYQLKRLGVLKRTGREQYAVPEKRKAQKAKREATPAMFRCVDCGGLMFARERSEHLLEAHGIQADEASMGAHYTQVEDTGS